MLHLLVAVLREEEKTQAVIERWQAGGIKGVTILASAGLGHSEDQLARDDVPLLPSLRTLFASSEISHRTLFSLIDDDAALERAIAAAIEVVGDFDVPDTGIMFVVPVTRAWGLRRHAEMGNP